jgi:hypothetical protein
MLRGNLVELMWFDERGRMRYAPTVAHGGAGFKPARFSGVGSGRFETCLYMKRGRVRSWLLPHHCLILAEIKQQRKYGRGLSPSSARQ